MSLPIIDRSARVQYTATAGQTSFVVPFEFFENSNLVVYRGTTQLTLSTSPTTADQYSVTGAGVEGGGAITLGAGATLGDVVTILRDVPVDRTTEFPSSGPFQIDALNAELARIVTMVQQQETNLAGRVLRLADFDTPGSLLTLPLAAARANRVLAFDADGNPAQGPDVAEVATLAASVANIALVAASIGNVNIVATYSLDVNTLAPYVGSIEIAADNIAAIVAAPGHAASAANSAAYAEAMTGPTYASTAAGLAATVDGEGFAVDNGNGTISIYRNVTGSAVLQREVGTVAWIEDAIATAQGAVAGAEANVAAGVAAAQADADAAVLAAETARNDAITAKNAAVAARDATVAGAAPTIYATTAAGLAATVSGQYFSVPSAVSSEYLILYLNNAGAAVEQKRYPAADLVKNLAATSVTGVEYAVQDGNDNASEYIEPATGKHYFTGIDAESINGIPRYRLTEATRRAGQFNASIVHHISYGQSLSLGNGSLDIHSLPNVDSGFFDSVMFNANGTASAGPRAQEGSGTVAQNHASFVPYEERPLTGTSPTGNLETPLGNALRMVKRLLRDEDRVVSSDFDYILLGSAPGVSNLSIASLSKGSAGYTNLTNDVTYGLANAQTLGKSYCVDVVYWSQGERDIINNTTRLAYKTSLLQLYTDLNTDIKAITGQSHDIKIVMYQTTTYDQFTAGYAGANIALAQLDAAKANPNIILATSIYAMEHAGATNVHLAAPGYAHLGAYYGYAAKRTIVDGASWANLYPTRLTRQGTILEIEFPDTGYPLAASSALFASQTNYGLTAVQSDGTTDNPIVSAAVVGPRRVRVVLTNAVGGYLRYGFASWGGNLHDTCDIDPGTARNLPLYRPVLTFDEAFV